MNTLDFDHSLSEALRLLRVYNDISQKEMAKKLDISTSYLSEVEKGKKEPTMTLIRKYSVLFSISASVILFFSENLQKEKGKDGFALQKLFLKTLQFFEKFNDKPTTL